MNSDVSFGHRFLNAAALQQALRVTSPISAQHGQSLPPSPHLVLDDLPPHDPRDVLVTVYPQDPLIDKDRPIIMPFPKDEIRAVGSKLGNDYFVTQNVRSPHLIRPDAHGDFIFAPGTPEFCQVNAHVHATRVVHMVERFRGEKLPWRFGNAQRQQVAVHVNQDRSGNTHTTFGWRSIDLDCEESRTLHKEVKDAEDADAIAHEVGHDILAGLRPTVNSDEKETAAYHEAFGDIVAMLYAMEFPENTRRAVQETAGNLRKQNIIAKLFEEDGKSRRLQEHPDARNGFYLRSAINAARYSPPDKNVDEHDFSQSYTAAFYDTLVALYEKSRADGAEPQQALLHARDTLAPVWARSIDFLPTDKISFASGVSALLQADEKLGTGIGSVIRESFAKRNIFPLDATPQR